ncbi:hypothetical protein TNCV_1367151 [Trichonephila clavipes]|nr:hypothetical protein TNCV_1367151 [Trichonephila clavipes]
MPPDWQRPDRGPRNSSLQRAKRRLSLAVALITVTSNFTSELLAIREALILYSTHPELSGTTEGLAIFSDSRAALEAIIKGDTNITSDQCLT